MELNKWRIIHSYQNIVDDGNARPLRCPDDDAVLVSTMDIHDRSNPDPVLWCGACDKRIRPGLDVWDQITAVVKEHYDI